MYMWHKYSNPRQHYSDVIWEAKGLKMDILEYKDLLEKNEFCRNVAIEFLVPLWIA